MQVVFENDWLGSLPCFFNEQTGAVATRIHDVIDYRNLAFDPDGLSDYLDFGFCTFGRTPVRHVRYVAPCSQLCRDAHGQLHEIALPDPVDAWTAPASDPDAIIEVLRADIGSWEKTVHGEIVLPLSGGYDSRLLAALVGDKSRLRTFTYGTSTRQSRSREVTRARKAARILNCRWEQVELDDFHQRIDAWEDLFGISTHAHGMYHIEFYENIVKRTGAGLGLLSGLVGDAWAGSIPRLPANSEQDLPALGLTRGVHAQRGVCRIRGDGRYRAAFWQARSHRFQDPLFQIIEVIRQKMTLLRFALLVPQAAGFKPWAPFLRPEIALAMTTLPADLRRKRRWQSEWFARHGLAVESSAGGDPANTLELVTLGGKPPAPLDSRLLSELFDPGYVESINQRVLQPGFLQRQFALARGRPSLAFAAGRLRLRNPLQEAYNTFMTLKPIEGLLRRRNAA